MTAVRGMPPGRAGRLWLVRRLGVARRGARLLDQKLRILRAEQERFTLLARRTGDEWERTCAEAERWLIRGALLGGRRAVRLAEPAAQATVHIQWATTMGVRYPDEGSCRLPEPDPAATRPANSALVLAVDAHRAALQAGVRHAAAVAALRVVDSEMAATRRRARAVETRWIPRLVDALREVTLNLDEAEHAEGVRLRWATRPVGHRAPGAREGAS